MEVEGQDGPLPAMGADDEYEFPPSPPHHLQQQQQQQQQQQPRITERGCVGADGCLVWLPPACRWLLKAAGWPVPAVPAVPAASWHLRCVCMARCKW